MALETTFDFLGAVRECHVYGEIQRPFEDKL